MLERDGLPYEVYSVSDAPYEDRDPLVLYEKLNFPDVSLPQGRALMIRAWLSKSLEHLTLAAESLAELNAIVATVEAQLEKLTDQQAARWYEEVGHWPQGKAARDAGTCAWLRENGFRAVIP